MVGWSDKMFDYIIIGVSIFHPIIAERIATLLNKKFLTMKKNNKLPEN